ncbi:hypothetical protein [Catenulispora subtropica]|uniref:Uncharacterized protein n=1 Tax=Catenulispora subtropica TaxID=450798 RepID=A0ABP5EIL1_9ACTN
MKRRTGLLFSSAVVVGLMGGVASGFAIQHGRPATPLPPIPHTLAPAAAPAAAESPDPATDDGAKLDGDLRALLVDAPAEAHDPAGLPARGWATIGDLAEYWPHPDQAFEKLNRERFRRAARAYWDLPDGTEVEIDLIQFRTTDDAQTFFGEIGFPVDVSTPTVDGTGTGYVGRYTSKGPDGFYTGYGLVRHGNVVEQVFVNRKQDPPEIADLTKITKEQADRL